MGSARRASIRWGLAGAGLLLALAAGACGGGGAEGSDGATPDGSGAAAGLEGGAGGDEPVDVVRVVDGDTLVVEVAGVEERVRLVGVNTPEEGECWYEQARDDLAALAGDQVRLEADVSDRDQHGRLLRHLFTGQGGQAGETWVNLELVRAGAAVSRSYPPDTTHQGALDEAEEVARTEGVGRWAAGACSDGPGGGASAEATVAIVAVVADPPGADEDDPNAETVTIRNDGGDAVGLGGWVLKDTSASHRYTFPAGFVLDAGASVVVHTGCGEDSASDLHWCQAGSLVWNNDGDTAYLEDPDGNTVSTFAA